MSARRRKAAIVYTVISLPTTPDPKVAIEVLRWFAARMASPKPGTEQRRPSTGRTTR